MLETIKNNYFILFFLKHKFGRKLINKITNKRYVIKKINSFKLILDLKDNWGVSKYILKHGNYDELSSEIAKKLIKTNSTVIDIGANIGYWSNLLASIDKTLKVISFEPEPSNLTLLRENININSFNKRVNVIPKALSNRKGKSNLYLSDDNAGDHRLYAEEKNRKHVEVEVSIGDEEIKDNNISFIKIDVQGYEYKVITGMKEVLNINKDISILTEFWPYGIRKAGDNPEEYIKIMYELGFKSYLVSEVNKKLSEVNIQEIMNEAQGEKHIDLIFTKAIIKL